MIDRDLLKELSEKLFNKLPNNQGLGVVKDDITKTFQVILEQTFIKLDLVTREQFNIQCQVLAETKAELAELNLKVANLEKNKER